MVGWCGDVLSFPEGLVVEPSSRFLFPFSRGFIYGLKIRRIIIQSELFGITFWGSSSSLDTIIFFVRPKTMTWFSNIFNRSFIILRYVQRNHMICKSIYNYIHTPVCDSGRHGPTYANIKASNLRWLQPFLQCLYLIRIRVVCVWARYTVVQHPFLIWMGTRHLQAMGSFPDDFGSNHRVIS